MPAASPLSEKHSTSPLIVHRTRSFTTTPIKQHGRSRKAAQTPSQMRWGRNYAPSYTDVVASACIMLFCPLMVIYFWITLKYFDGSMLASAEAFLRRPATMLVTYAPRFSAKAAGMYIGWVIVQAFFFAVLPGKIGHGQATPSGLVLPYKINGLLAWILSHAAVITAGTWYNWISPSIIADYWEGLLVATNIVGYSMAAVAYIKARVTPSHPADCKFSGSIIYDIFMGVELNPRVGRLGDFKLFFNGRPGIIGWTLINFSFAAAQYARYGYVSNSMVLLNLLQAIYVVDFFANEDWYLRTIGRTWLFPAVHGRLDVAHDHFGFYLAWGDSVWLPFMYTLQAQYLFRHPINHKGLQLGLMGALGVAGYLLFRAVNYQKDYVRRHDGKCNIWGKPAKVIRASFRVGENGSVEHQSLLLCSGFWGLARHANYTGDLLLSLAMCLTCGFDHLLPYFYAIYMTILLVHRIKRDDARCRGKYGKYWEQYCDAVPYRLVPYVY